MSDPVDSRAPVLPAAGVWPGMEAWPRLTTLLDRARLKGGVRTGVVYPLSFEALDAAVTAHRLGLMHAVLYGPQARLQELAARHELSLDGIELVATPDEPAACAALAVSHCHEEAFAAEGPEAGSHRVLKALMKGSLHTDELLGAVVARAGGLRTSRRISHVFVFDIPAYHKLLMLADAVVNIAPDLKTKQSIVQNAIDAAHRLGIARPKVAALAAVEGMNPNIPATIDAASLVAMAGAGQITGGLVEGAFGFDNAISARAARIKGLNSEVAGDADLLIAPDLNAGNILYKSFIYMAGAECAGVILGAAVPVILTSRADSVACRIASCALASLLSPDEALQPS